jgi:hypothetical protein
LKFSPITRGYFLVFGALLLLYGITCAPGSLWQDSGLFQYRIWHNDIEGEIGLALAHPLYHIIGIAVKYIPWGEFGYRVNLISALAAALAGANLFLLLRLWVGKYFPAIMAAATLGFSWTMWQHACIAEVYTLYIALFLGELVVLLQYCRTKRIGYLYLLGLLNGLAIANHMWGTIALVCYLVFSGYLLFKKQISGKQLAIVALLWIVGALPYEYLIIKNMVVSGDIPGTLSTAVFGNVHKAEVLNTEISMSVVKENVLFMGMNFPTPNVLLFFVGLWALYRKAPGKGFAYILLALTVLFFVFAFRYTVPDRYVFFLPFYCLAAILTGLGCSVVIRNKGKVLAGLIGFCALLPIPVYAVAPYMAKKAGMDIGSTRQIPYRDDYKWFLQPWRTGCEGPQRFAREIFDTVGENAIVYADSTTVYALLYEQEVKKQRSDIKIISTVAHSADVPDFNEFTISELLAERSVYVVSREEGYCPKFLRDNYDLLPAGIIWQVK